MAYAVNRGGIATAAMLLRDKQFAACTALMGPIGLYELIGYVKASEKKLKAGVRYALPFAVVIALCAGLYLGNEVEWNNSIYKEHRQFIKAVSELVDFKGGVPKYETMPEVYDSLGIDEDMVNMAMRYKGFDDNEKWNAEACEKIIEARAQLQGKSNIRTLLETYIACIPMLYNIENVITYPYGFLIMLIVWILIGKKDIRSILTVVIELLLFSTLYLILISENRYMTRHTDTGFFMAMSITLLWLLENKEGWLRKGLCLVLVAMSVFLGLYLNRSRCILYPYNSIKDFSSSQNQIEELINDDHLIFMDIGILEVDYSPTQTLPAKYRDSLVLMGGWVAQNPAIEEVMAQYGVTNPYRDMVDNDKVYVIYEDIEQLVRYINNNYMGEKECAAEVAEPISSQTSINVYRIVTK